MVADRRVNALNCRICRIEVANGEFTEQIARLIIRATGEIEVDEITVLPV